MRDDSNLTKRERQARAETMSRVEPEDLSRFEGEGGRQVPCPSSQPAPPPWRARQETARKQEIEFRHVPPGSGDFRELLHRRYTAPFYYPLPTSRWGINE
jgi:hypothetical protein